MSTEQSPLLPKAQQGPSRLDFVLLMMGVWSLVFISSLDGTIVATLISTIGSDLENMQLSSWIGTAYLLSLCAFTPLYGRLANILGRRPSILFAGTLFGAATVLCGFAQNMTQLIALRALAGAGSSGMTVVGSVVMSDSVPLKSRGLYQGFANLLFGLGAAVGGPLGGWLGDTIGWRAAFVCQAPFLVVALILLFSKVREPESPLAPTNTTIYVKLKRIDYAGSATLVAALVTFLIGLNIKTTTSRQWGDSQVLGLLVAGIVLLCFFVWIELRYASEPVMPFSMISRRTPGFVALNNFLVSILIFSTIYNIPLYWTAARLRSSTNAGAHLIPYSVCVSIGSLSAGWYMRKTGRYWKLQALAGLCMVVPNIIMATWTTETPEWVFYATVAPTGLGYAATLTTTLLALIASVARDDIPVATALSYLFRTSGQSLGVSLSAALTQTLLARNLRARITGEDADEIITKILDSTAYIHTLPQELQAKAMTSWAIALRALFYCQIGLSVAVLLSLLPIEEYSLPDTVAGKPVRHTTSEERDAEAREE
ncbi:MFS general substrate transporter [Roridomyces roridus]|uniref:MFS general substrate transporter n=1 Tax=Roridomyces roridus TaxID=1738132 RepID=A0AAD7FD12_9AGAR|nr:MFS general substrate transporter [Roridomyces roridus]